MGLDYHASSSPLLVLTPDRQHQANYFGSHYQDPSSIAQRVPEPNTTSPSVNAMSDAPAPTTAPTTTMDMSSASRRPIRPHFPRPPSINYLATSAPLSGRKRSIADVHDDEPHQDIDGSYVPPLENQPPSPPKPQGEPVLGPGMTLVYPDDPQYSALAAESQSGTWVEEKAVEAAHAEARPAISSRKSQRREEPGAISVDIPATTVVNNGVNGASPTEADQPVDKLSVTLGVGWKRIPEAQAPAAKGWEKYITNHYSSIDDPSILLYNEGLHVYLVRALSASNDTQQCWWVFQEDLSACRLVGHCEEDAIRSLQRQETISMGPVVHARTDSRPRSMYFQHRSMPSVNEPIVSMDEPFNPATSAPTTNASAPNGAGDVEMEM